MSNQFRRMTTGLLVMAAIALIPGQAWAIYYALGPSKDEWGLKYSVAVEDAEPDMVTVKFTLESEGRLKPIHSISLAVHDKQKSSNGSQRFDVKGRLEFKPTADGKRVGQMKIRKDEVDRAILRVLTQNVDGRFQSAAAKYYDIPVAKYLKETAPPSVAAPPAPPSAKVKK